MALLCATNEVAKWDGIAWVCSPDIDTDSQLTEVQVEGFVTNSPLDLASGTTLNGATIATKAQNVIVVAKSGGDFTSIQAALDST